MQQKAQAIRRIAYQNICIGKQGRAQALPIKNGNGKISRLKHTYVVKPVAQTYNAGAKLSHEPGFMLRRPGYGEGAYLHGKFVALLPHRAIGIRREDVYLQKAGQGFEEPASASVAATATAAATAPAPTPALESLNVVIPWSRRRFQFTSKQNCLQASGTIELDGTTLTFEPGETYACLDLGRGIWPYASSWNWGSFSGLSHDGRLVGGNLGAGWTDGTGMTENAIWFDGRVSKLHEDVSYAYDRHDLMKPWTIRTTSTKRVDLRFEPFYDRFAHTNFVIIKSDMHQMIGRYYGTIVDDNDIPVELSGLIGWAEEHQARW